MKYSGIIGVVSAIVLIVACYMPWVTVPEHKIRISGLVSENFDLFGKPGLMHIFFAILAIAFFFIPRIWAKRTNLFVCALNLAWALANFYRIGVICRNGDCPHRESGLYLALAASVLMFIMCLLPRVAVRVKF
jgi:hypothetical protein